MKKYTTIEEYVANYPKSVQLTLDEIRRLIKKLVPDAIETISYGIPTYKYKGKNLIHFAAYGKHIGLYPGSQAIELFKGDLTDYKTSKGTIQFPLDKPIPLELVSKIVRSNIEEIDSKTM